MVKCKYKVFNSSLVIAQLLHGATQSSSDMRITFFASWICIKVQFILPTEQLVHHYKRVVDRRDRTHCITRQHCYMSPVSKLNPTRSPLVWSFKRQ